MEPWFSLWCVCVVVGCMVCTCMWRCSCPCRCVWRPVVFINCFSKFLRNWPGWRLSFRQTSWLVSFGHLPVSTLCWGLQTQVTVPGFYTGAEVPTFTPHGYMASTIQRAKSPARFSLFLKTSLLRMYLGLQVSETYRISARVPKAAEETASWQSACLACGKAWIRGLTLKKKKHQNS